mmetsp:Transcript_11955/g.17851  ORF Transcript_11955/g.17851 Transcript_11955/m.17851 type:complete len:89 (+) Transcript_11955:773-1039(+)
MKGARGVEKYTVLALATKPAKTATTPFPAVNLLKVEDISDGWNPLFWCSQTIQASKTVNNRLVAIPPSTLPTINTLKSLKGLVQQLKM